MKNASNTLKNFNVMIIEEDIMLSSELKYMLKKMGFYDNKIYKTSCLSIFKSLIKKYSFNLIICHYSLREKLKCQTYLHLYRDCEFFSRDCSFVFITEKLCVNDTQEIETLAPDNVLEIPFNYNQFNPFITDSLIKRKILAIVYRYIDQENFDSVNGICELLSEKKNTWRTEVFKATIEHYVSLKQYDNAINILNDLRVKEPAEWLFIKLIEINSMLDNHSVSLEIAQEYEALGFSDNPLISEITAQNSILNANLTSALPAIENIVSRYPDSISSKINLSYLYIAAEDYEKALKIFNSIIPENIINDEQYYCIAESKVYLDVRFNIMKGSLSNTPLISNQLKELLKINFDSIDKLNTTKQFHEIIDNINNKNPIYSEKKLTKLWKATKLPHRKLIIIAIAYYFGFIDILSGWLEVETKKITKVKNIDDAIKSILYKQMSQLIQRKQTQIAIAKEMEQHGNDLESFIILSKEAPSEIINHVNLVNSITKNQLSLNLNDIDSVLFQFKYSISILMHYLLMHNPNHPKIDNLKEINRIISARLNITNRNTTN